MPATPRHSISVAGAVVDSSGAALCIRRRDNGRWEPPGGVLELGETLHDGLLREIAEETQLVVEPVALTGVYQNLPRGIVAFVFRCEPISGVAVPTIEASEVAWLAADEIRDRMDEAYAVRLLDALTWRNGSIGPSLRSHDGVHLLPAPHS